MYAIRSYYESGEKFARVLNVCADKSSSREDVLKAMRHMVRSLVHDMLGTELARHFSRIMMQEQISPTPAFGILYEGFFRLVHSVWAALLGRLTGLPMGSMELDLRALSVMGQLVIFRVGMTATLRYLGSDRLSDEHLACIADLVVRITSYNVCYTKLLRPALSDSLQKFAPRGHGKGR